MFGLLWCIRLQSKCAGKQQILSTAVNSQSDQSFQSVVHIWSVKVKVRTAKWRTWHLDIQFVYLWFIETCSTTTTPSVRYHSNENYRSSTWRIKGVSWTFNFESVLKPMGLQLKFHDSIIPRLISMSLVLAIKTACTACILSTIWRQVAKDQNAVALN